MTTELRRLKEILDRPMEPGNMAEHLRLLQTVSEAFGTVLEDGQEGCNGGKNPENCPFKRLEAVVNMESVILRMKEISGDLRVLRCSLAYAVNLADGKVPEQAQPCHHI